MSALSDARAERDHLLASVQQQREGIQQALATASGALDAHLEHVGSRRWQLFAEARTAVERRPELYAPWGDNGFWNEWACAPELPQELRVGELVDPADLPATVPVFGGRTVVVATQTAPAAEQARGLLRSLALRAATALGDRVVLHLIDPHQEGFGFPERGVLPQDAPRTDDVARDLKAVIDAGFAFQQRNPGLTFADLTPEQQRAEPVHVVLAQDFPRGYGYQAVEHLNRVANLAPSGIQLFVHHHVTADHGAAHLDLMTPVVVSLDAAGRATEAWGSLVAHVDAPPPRELVAALAARMPMSTIATGEPVEEASSLAWSSVNSTDPATWWQGDASREVCAVFGRTVDGQPLELRLGQDAAGNSAAHAVIGGTTGSGKGVLLQSAILSLATRYSPDDLRFYLLDGQNGVTMQDFAELPHADLVTINTPIDLARGVLTDVGAELTRRDGLLTGAGVNDIASYWRAGGRDMPRLVVVIDEYQALFEGDRRDEAAGILTRIAAQGRKVGLHLLLASQRFHASGLLNQNALFDNIATRISLNLPTDAIDGLDEFARDGRELIRSHATGRGKAVLNARGGAEGASVAGFVAYTPPEEAKALVSRLAARADAAGERRRPVVIDGDAQPRPADSRTLAALSRIDPADHAALKAWAESDARSGGLTASGWQPYDHPFPFIVGRTFSVYGPAFAKVDRAAEHNVMLVAGDPEVLTGMVLGGLASAALGVAPGRLTVALAAELPPPGSWAGVLSDGLAALLGRRGHTVRTYRSGSDAVELLDAAVAEIDRRAALDPVALSELGPYLFVILGADRVPALRRVEGRYEMGPSEAGQKLERLLKEGPFVGVHGVVGFTSRAVWSQVMPEKGRRQFVHRFVQQVSEDDSRLLLDSAFGFKVMPPGVGGPQRAGYVNRDSGAETVFLPYTTAGRTLDDLGEFFAGGAR